MRVALTLVLIAIAFTFASANVENVKTVFQCQNNCNCRPIYNPVCGKSGRTHANACFATCFRDIIVKRGPCNKCLNPKPVKKSNCTWRKFGKNGRRQHCCTWLQQGTRTYKRSCGWKGLCHYTFRKRVCNYKRNGAGKQMHCCSWTSRKVGKKVTSTKKKCKFTGHIISNKFVNGCKWVVIGGNQKRRKCCSTAQQCRHIGKKTICRNIRKQRCRWASSTVTIVKRKQCSIKRVKKYLTQKQCCNITWRCVKSKCGRRNCKVMKKRCANVGHSHYSRRYSKCNWRAVRGGRRQRCCTWTRQCRNKKCAVVSKKCAWRGLVRTTKLVNHCRWRQRTKHIKQRLCCSYYHSCCGRKCHNSKKKCVFRGAKITRVHHKSCQWRTVGRNGKRRQCCTHSKVCLGKKCSKTKKCRWTGRVITSRTVSKCHWKHISKCSKRRFCCTYVKRCNGKACTVKKQGKCKPYGYIVVSKPGKSCTLTKRGKFSKQLKCCHYTRSCKVYKGKSVCNKVNKKCKWTGSKRWYFPKKSCRYVKFGKNATRQKCCKWTNYCVKTTKNCTPIQKKCTYGTIVQTHVSSKCHWKKFYSRKQIRQCKNIPAIYDVKSKFLSAGAIRARSLRRCRHKNKFVFYSCVYDESKGELKVKNEYIKVAKFLKNTPGTVKKCSSTGDPHNRSFSGKGFNVYNVQAHRRLVYKSASGDVEVTTKIRFSKRWGKRGINVKTDIRIGSKRFSLSAPKNKKWNKCGGSLKAVARGTKTYRTYNFASGKTLISVGVSILGYMNVYVTSNSNIIVGCKGDCCKDPKPHVSKHGNTTYRWGNPFKVKFGSTCTRKRQAYLSCKAKYGKNVKRVTKCIQRLSKNYTKRVQLRQCRKIPAKFDTVSKFYSAYTLRARALKRCKHKNKFVFYSCVFDESKGQLKVKNEYIKVANFLKNGSGKAKKCFSTGDPHLRGFAGKGFNVYNVQANKRVLYKSAKGDVEVTTKIQFNRKWGTRGINVEANVRIGSQKWSLGVPIKNKWKSCGGNLKAIIKKAKTSRTYTFVSGKTTISVVVSISGYMNVYVTANDGLIAGCKGDCCRNVKAHYSKHGKTTYRWGNPFKIKFGSACTRKAFAYESCKKIHGKNDAKVIKCIQTLSKNTSKAKKVVRKYKCLTRLRRPLKKAQRCCTIVKKCKCTKLGDKSNCKITKKYCKYVGTPVVLTHKKKCFVAAFGKHATRTKCCTHSKKCKGNKLNCKTQVHSCKWKGKVSKVKTWSRCSYVKFGKNGKRNKCCSTVQKCTGKKCKTTKKCMFVGPCIYVRSNKFCGWKKVGNYKQQRCCVSKVVIHGKIKKTVSTKCYFTGKRFGVKKVYYTKRHMKKAYKHYTKYCTQLFKCSKIGSKHSSCKFAKNVKCKIVRKVRAVKHRHCHNVSYHSKGKRCVRKRCVVQKSKRSAHCCKRKYRKSRNCITTTRYWAGKGSCKKLKQKLFNKNRRGINPKAKLTFLKNLKDQ